MTVKVSALSKIAIDTRSTKNSTMYKYLHR